MAQHPAPPINAVVEDSADRLIPDAELLSRFVPIDRSTLWRARRDGSFPKPIKIGRRNLTRLADLRRWVAERAEAGR